MDQLLTELKIQVKWDEVLFLDFIEYAQLMREDNVVCIHGNNYLAENRNAVSHQHTTHDHDDDGKYPFSIVVRKHVTVADDRCVVYTREVLSSGPVILEIVNWVVIVVF